MKPPPIRYERADSLDAALQFLAEHGDTTKVLAGGQSLIPLLNLRLARPETVLDIGDLDELRFVRPSNGTLEVGALTTQRELERDPELPSRCPLLSEAVPHIGHVAIRNRGTIGGTIAHADPAAELPVVLAAGGGAVTLRSRSAGERSVPAGEFFRGFLMTAVRPDELVTSISFPVAADGEGSAFEEFARRPGDFALTAVACTVQPDADGALGSARIALGGVGSTPLALEGLDALAGASPDEAPAAAAGLVARAVDPVPDIHGSVEYRRHLAGELAKRAVRRALTGRSE